MKPYLIGLSLIAFVLGGSALLFTQQASATGCYNDFIFNWFTLNTVLSCLDNNSSGNAPIIEEQTDTSTNVSFSYSDAVYAEYANTGSRLIAKTISAVSFNMFAYGVPSGVMNAGVFDSSGNIVHSFGLMNESDVSTTEFTWYIFNGTNYTIQNGDRIGIYIPATYSGFDQVFVSHSASDVYDTSNSVFSAFNGTFSSAWTDNSNSDLAFRFYLVSGNNTLPSLNTLSDVNVSNMTNGQVLEYDSNSALWTNKDHIQQLSKVVLQSANNSITSSFTSMKHLIITCECMVTNNTLVLGIQFNNDTGNNYATSLLGAGTSTSASEILPFDNQTIANTDNAILNFIVDNNNASSRKITSGSIAIGADSNSANAPLLSSFAGKWDNTTNQISSITINIQSGSGLYDTGSILTIWGYN